MSTKEPYLKSCIMFLIPFIVIVIIWEVLALLFFSDTLMIPAPSQLILRFYELMFPKFILVEHVSKSLYRFVVGYFLAVACGLGMGILMGLNKSVYKMFAPFISLFISLPTIAWVPLLLVFTGIGDVTIIIAIFLGSFFSMVYNTTNGIRNVDHDLIRASRMMGAGKYTIFSQVILPGSMVSIITGLKLGIGNSWRALVGAEMLAATAWGIGYMIFASRTFYDIETMFIGLILIGALSLLVDTILIRTLESITIKKWGMLKE